MSESEHAVELLDIAEQGRRHGQPIRLDRRLFVNFTAFGGCQDPTAAAILVERAGIEGAVYTDVNDPSGVGHRRLGRRSARFRRQSARCS